MPRPVPFAVACLVAAFAPACSGSAFNNFPTAPTAPPAAQITETFDGRVTVNGAITHPFIAQRAGTVTARLAALDPEDAVVGLYIGTWTGNACQVFLPNDTATLNTAVIGTAQAAGNFCVRVYDVGQMTAPVSYQVVVTHSS